ncbi:TRAP transporter small permease subunit [Roseovarius sp. ZX-A-9]|uniref:TRAP transporter small permease subunit n=1 Tax=Roseovarius sp. ZX-A-9 TaxID=3014783 RepID=UPI0023308D4A|nr:TRAP transporter small permease [Roseovarius sp. ZX-A-9]
MLLAVSLLVTADVLTRRILGAGTFSSANELSGYAFAIATSWSLAFVLFERSNIRIDVLYSWFPIGVKAALDIVSLVLLGLFILFLSWRTAFMLLETVKNDTSSVTPLATPMIIPQGLWALGLVLFLTCWAALLLHNVIAFIRRDFKGVCQRSSPNSTEM